MEVTRFADLPEGIVALTATARGKVNNHMTQAAQRAFGELKGALASHGLIQQVGSYLSIVPDQPQGPDDPHCRYVAAVVLGYQLACGRGQCVQAKLPLSGTLAWQTLAGGRYAVFTHIGPYTLLHGVWQAIYRDWLPASGQQLRDAPPMALCLNSPDTTLPENLRTEIWLPVGL